MECGGVRRRLRTLGLKTSTWPLHVDITEHQPRRTQRPGKPKNVSSYCAARRLRSLHKIPQGLQWFRRTRGSALSCLSEKQQNPVPFFQRCSHVFPVVNGPAGEHT
ncbi:hypothetical protein, unlikely [Trypanosoma brucei gambiense DAL972]|uniref:Uncharacterized protein n=1 Tax=Trypanosoma brucei gambiense (strain MHOM/CI/86/DAL972) TaxID=679716 RepID=D0A7I7_TRYB9|nr:hypothetical protein, unlikely [Trypanosoma brucei gambiense DAL972]CBH17638.1 hypothetical protein, unlikely [Trypanosoma brucei gambiense DAL972]|eukprot:XP_011779902.1 hypothetical protein, unlikely [Trypanosoma brucei gambiense DAL972]